MHDEPVTAEAAREPAEGERPRPYLTYLLCPRCARAVPAAAGERYCSNDGARLLDACHACGSPITSPYARHCPRCGARYGDPAG